MTTLYVREGSDYRAATSEDILQRARALIAQRFRVGAPVLDTPARTRDFLTMTLGSREHEIFSALFLNSQYRLIEYVELFRGTIDSASVHPREVVKEALARNAAAVALAHQHPSGNPSPSAADECVTRRIREALNLVGIRLVDHFVIGDRVTSMAELGMI